MLTEEKNAGLTGRIIPINIEEQMKSAYIDHLDVGHRVACAA